LLSATLSSAPLALNVVNASNANPINSRLLPMSSAPLEDLFEHKTASAQSLATAKDERCPRNRTNLRVRSMLSFNSTSNEKLR
jgi:hypothetical protein